MMMILFHLLQVGWVKADTKAIQAIGKHVITHNHRVSVSQEDRTKYHLHIINASLEESGPYICQLNTDPMKSQVILVDTKRPPYTAWGTYKLSFLTKYWS